MSAFPEYDQYDGLGLAGLVKKKEITPGELVEEAIARIERHNPQLNAVIHKMYDLARQTAQGDLPDGPFCGVPFLLKDLAADYAGVPTRMGSRSMHNYIPDHDSEIVRRYKAAGVVILGKTNTPEFGLSPYTEPETFGPTHNPWNLAYTPGGSSGGSAAAVAARIVPLAHGNDGGGSLRAPASACGIFSLKPSRGRTSFGPDRLDGWHGLAIHHVLSLSVRDSAAMLDATHGTEPGAPYHPPLPERSFLENASTPPGRLRIAFTAEPFMPGAVHPDCIQGLETSVALCRELGHEVIEAAPGIDKELFARAFLTLLCGETQADVREIEMLQGRRPTFRDFEALTWAAALLGSKLSAADFAQAVRFIQTCSQQLAIFLQDYDVLLTPTLSLPPVPIGAFQLKGAQALGLKIVTRLNAGWLMHTAAGMQMAVDHSCQFIPFTPLFNATGNPAMSAPLYWNAAGLPVGMQFAGRYGDEATLFRLAGQLEEARPWFNRRPSVCG